jgi:hypothetical protein
MDELVNSKSYAKQQFRAGRGGHRGGRGRGRSIASAHEHLHDMEEEAQHAEDENSNEEEGIEGVESSTRLDFEALLTEAKSYYSQSFYRNQSFQGAAKDELLPPSTHDGIDKSVIALDLPSLAQSLLSSVKLSQILGIEDVYLSKCLEVEGQKAPPMAPTVAPPSPAAPKTANPPPRHPNVASESRVPEPDRTQAPSPKQEARRNQTSTADDDDDLDALLNSTRPNPSSVPQIRPVAAVTLPPKQAAISNSSTLSSVAARDSKTAQTKKKLEDWLDD